MKLQYIGKYNNKQFNEFESSSQGAVNDEE